MRRPIATAFALLVFAVAPVTAGVSQGEPGPKHYPGANVLLISVCSVRADHMGCYGYRRQTTPNLDRFAAGAFVFDSAFTQWPKTAPAFASIVTGKYGHTTGVMRVTPDRHLDDSHVTLAEAFGAAGYQTAAFLTSVALNPKTNIAQGFDEVQHVGLKRDAARYSRANAGASEWARQRDRDQPFFLWVHYNSAHLPYQGHGADPDMFVGDSFYDPERRVTFAPRVKLDLPPNYPNRKQILRENLHGTRFHARQGRPAALDKIIARYDAGIFATDMWIGKLLEELDAAGALDNTIVALVGDHGEALGEHDYYFEHGRFPYDDCLRVPMAIRLPGQKEAGRISVPVAASALAATVLELVKIPPPAEMEIASVAAALNGEAVAPHVFSESGYHPDYTLSVRDRRWKLIHVPNRHDQSLQLGREYELYDWQSDPGETRNLVDRHPEELARLRGVLRDWSQPWVKAAYGELGKRAKPSESIRERLRALGYSTDD